MSEIVFQHKNIKKWKEFELFLENNTNSNPDKLYELYIELTDDLAFAKTYFPDSESFQYLNQLTLKLHGIIYQNKPVSKKKFSAFWLHDFPLVFYDVRKEFFVVFALFSVSILIGILSTLKQTEFVNAILGDQYVNMTMENISNGDPLAVYKKMNQTPMFLGITINNIKVSFFAFVLGILTAVGSGYVMFTNGVMLGTFHAFLAQNGVITDAFATIWIHGTIEIFAILVAGTAGVVMGNSFVFPGTYKRLVSFKAGALKGAKLILGLIPLFIIAGFLEGFVTRYTDAPYSIRFAIIFFSLAGIVFYFFIYPKHLLNTSIQNEQNKN